MIGVGWDAGSNRKYAVITCGGSEDHEIHKNSFLGSKFVNEIPGWKISFWKSQ